MGHDGLDGTELIDDLVAVEDGDDVVADLVTDKGCAVLPEGTTSVPMVSAAFGQMGLLGTADAFALALVGVDELVVEVHGDQVLVDAQPDLLPDKREWSGVWTPLVDKVIVRVDQRLVPEHKRKGRRWERKQRILFHL
jgi:hypothetical protein